MLENCRKAISLHTAAALRLQCVLAVLYLKIAKSSSFIPYLLKTGQNGFFVPI